VNERSRTADKVFRGPFALGVISSRRGRVGGGRYVAAQVWHKLVKTELVRFVQFCEKNVALLGVCREAQSFDGGKGISRGGCLAPVTVDAWQRLAVPESAPQPDLAPLILPTCSSAASPFP